MVSHSCLKSSRQQDWKKQERNRLHKKENIRRLIGSFWTDFALVIKVFILLRSI